MNEKGIKLKVEKVKKSKKPTFKVGDIIYFDKKEGEWKSKKKK